MARRQRTRKTTHRAEHLDGLAPVVFAIDGRRLFSGERPPPIQSHLDRIGAAPFSAGSRQLNSGP